VTRRVKRNAVIILAAVAVSIIARESVDGRSITALHTELISSNPADGDSLTTSPPEVRLIFSGPVEPALSLIRLVTADGAELELNPSSEDEGRVLLARLPGLGNGNYTIEWSTVSRAKDCRSTRQRQLASRRRESCHNHLPVAELSGSAW
jgi:methionine-rich copper-binding protein CopC